jgi:hypothetical protein
LRACNRLHVYGFRLGGRTVEKARLEVAALHRGRVRATAMEEISERYVVLDTARTVVAVPGGSQQRDRGREPVPQVVYPRSRRDERAEVGDDGAAFRSLAIGRSQRRLGSRQVPLATNLPEAFDTTARV